MIIWSFKFPFSLHTGLLTDMCRPPTGEGVFIYPALRVQGSSHSVSHLLNLAAGDKVHFSHHTFVMVALVREDKHQRVQQKTLPHPRRQLSQLRWRRRDACSRVGDLHVQEVSWGICSHTSLWLHRVYKLFPINC